MTMSAEKTSGSRVENGIRASEFSAAEFTAFAWVPEYRQPVRRQIKMAKIGKNLAGFDKSICVLKF
jgi:hypothetical protein